MRERDVVLDRLKGWAILIVVASHILAFGLVSDAVYTPVVLRGILFLQMPLFFCLSGMASSLQVGDRSTLGTWVLKRTKRLLLPFLVWGLVSVCINQVSVWSLFLVPSHFLWFLWALFFISVIFHCIKCTGIPRRYGFVLVSLSVMVTLMVMNRLLHGLFGWKEIAYYFFFYVVGDCLYRFKPLFQKGRDVCSYAAVVASVLFILLMMGSVMWCTPYNVDDIFDFSMKLTGRMLLSMLCSVGLAVLFISFFYLKDAKHDFGWMGDLGKSTLGVYAIHYYFIYAFRYFGIRTGWFFLDLGLYLVLVTGLSWWTVWMMGKVKVLRLLFLGA
jgi:fucose 4-O-acetylase-like acetyltransferase